MLDTIQALGTQFQSHQPLAFSAIPDLGLYMDQVVNWIDRQLAAYKTHPQEKMITPAMINNYVKLKVIPRPTGKKYGQDHLALLLMVCLLKRALPIEQIGRLLVHHGTDVQALWEGFCHLQQEALTTLARTMTQCPGDPMACAVTLAIQASAQCYAAQSLIAKLPMPGAQVLPADS